MIELRMIETEGLSGRREVSIRANALHIDEYIDNLIRPLLLAWGFQPGNVDDALGDDYAESSGDRDCNCGMDMHDNKDMGEVEGGPEDRGGVVTDYTPNLRGGGDMAKWVFHSEKRAAGDPGIAERWGYKWADEILQEACSIVVWKERDYGNALDVAVGEGTLRMGMRVEFLYRGPNAIGHWEHISYDPDEETMYWNTRYIDSQGKWMQKFWFWDFHDWRRYRLIMQPDPEAVVRGLAEQVRRR
jgi:hypothetical protein